MVSVLAKTAECQQWKNSKDIVNAFQIFNEN